MRSFRTPHPRLVLIPLGILLLALGACGKKTTAPMASGDPAPTPDTPRHAVDLFRWCWVHKSNERFAELFTDDMRFKFSIRDSAGAPARDSSLGREATLDSVANIFAVPSSIQLDYFAIDPDEPDPLPGRDPGWHRLLRVEFKLAIRTRGGTFLASPLEEFYLTRGDSAAIPADLVARGFVPDPNRWYISTWSDVTPPPAARPGVPGAKTRWPLALDPGPARIGLRAPFASGSSLR